MSNFGKNIRKIRNVRNMSQQAFADIFDLKRATLGAYEEGRSEPKIDTLLKIANHFSITVDDLLTKELTVNQLLKFKGDLTLQTGTTFKEKFTSVPCLTEKTQGDYADSYGNEEFLTELPQLQLPLDQTKKYIGYTVLNLEMTNHDHGLFPNDVVIGEFVPKASHQSLENGSIVLALVADKLILRRYYCTPEKLILRADHKIIEDISFPFQEVKELWEIKYLFFKRMPEPAASSQGLEDKLSFLEQEFLKLRNKL